jgi:hypothetical protein
MLKRKLGSEYEPQRAPPREISYLNMSVGRFESALGDDPKTAEWMWADEEETEHRKCLRIEPPRNVQDHAGTEAAQGDSKFMCNAPAVARGPDKLQPFGMCTNTAGDSRKRLAARPQDQAGNLASSGIQNPMDGVGAGRQGAQQHGHNRGMGTRSERTASALRPKARHQSNQALDVHPRWRKAQRGRRDAGYRSSPCYRRPTLTHGPVPPPPPPPPPAPPPPSPPPPPPTPRPRRKVVVQGFKRILVPREPGE